jgi:hypothetical protein
MALLNTGVAISWAGYYNFNDGAFMFSPFVPFEIQGGNFKKTVCKKLLA